MSTCFLKSGNTFKVTSKAALDLHEALPAGNYVVKEDPRTGELYLEEINAFSFKGKQYGDHSAKCDRIFNTFMDRPYSTGVMLTGEKGSGKSLLAKLVCIKGNKEAVPTIVINAPWCGDKFNAFLTAIKQPAIILFDEFEKVYDSDEQEQILTLLDGVFPSKKLFIITCNDKWRVDSHMRNRPGRIYYMLDFKGLEEDFIIEYCEDNLLAKNKKYIKRICAIASLFAQFNFDMLKAMVEEMNRYGESPESVLKMLNVKPEFEDGKHTRYAVALTVGGSLVAENMLYSKEWEGNPLNGKVQVGYRFMTKNREGEEYMDDETIEFTTGDIKKIDPHTNTYTFVNKDNVAVTLTRVVKRDADFYKAF